LTAYIFEVYTLVESKTKIMKKIFERIISKFKEFWGNRKNISRSYFLNGEYHLSKNSIRECISSAPLRFMVSNIREFQSENYFEDINARKRRRHCIYVVKNFDGTEAPKYKRLVNFWEIVGNSRFDVFDSNRIDIDLWINEASSTVMVKRKVVVVSISEIFMN